MVSFLELHPVDIVCVTETWMSSDDIDLLSCYPGYSTMRRDRNNRGGGIMAIVRDSLLPAHLDHLNSTDIEVTFLSVTLSNSNWLVGIVYRPPNSDATFFDKLQDICDGIHRARNSGWGTGRNVRYIYRGGDLVCFLSGSGVIAKD